MFDPWSGSNSPQASWPKIKNTNKRSNTVTNSMEALKMVHILKKKETVQVNVTMRSADFSISLCRVALAKVSFQRMLSKKLIGFLDP